MSNARTSDELTEHLLAELGSFPGESLEAAVKRVVGELAEVRRELNRVNEVCDRRSQRDVVNDDDDDYHDEMDDGYPY